MSLQVCHCGWSKVTTYQGLRTHQGKMGCTPRGVKVEESEQHMYMWGNVGSINDFRLDIYTDIKTESVDYYSEMSLQVCHCGWSKKTTYHGLRTHQGMMGCTPKGVTIPKKEQYDYKSQWEKVDQKKHQPAKRTAVKKENVPMSASTNIRTNSAATTLKIKKEYKSDFETPQHFFQTATNSKSRRELHDFSTGVQANSSLLEHPTPTYPITVVRPKEKDRKNRTLSQIADRRVTLDSARTAAIIKEEPKSPLAISRRPSQRATKTKSVCQPHDLSTGVQVNRSDRERPAIPPRPKGKDRKDQALSQFADCDMHFYMKSLVQEHPKTTHPATVVRPKEKRREDQTSSQDVTPKTVMKPVHHPPLEPFSPRINSATPATIKEEPKSPFAIPQRSFPEVTNSEASHQLQDFGTGFQVNRSSSKCPTIPPLATVVQLKENNTMDQTISQAGQERVSSELQQKIQLTEEKMGDIIQMERACENVPDSTSTNTQMNSVAAEAMTKEDPKSWCETSQPDPSSGMKGKELAQMFSAGTTEDTAVRPKDKSREEQELSQHLAQKLTATTAQETVQPKEKEEENPNIPQNMADPKSPTTTQVNTASTEATTGEDPSSSCETAQLSHFSTGLKVKELARMFSAITTQETAVKPQDKHGEERKHTSQNTHHRRPSAKLMAQKLSATTVEETAVRPQEKDAKDQNLPQNVPDSTSSTTQMKPTSAQATIKEAPTSSCETAQVSHCSTGLKVKELAQMFSTTTTQKTAVQLKEKHREQQKLSQVKFIAQKLSATAAKETVDHTKEKDKKDQNLQKNVPNSTSTTNQMNPASAKATTEEDDHKSSFKTAQPSHFSTGLKVKELARMFSATTTQETAVKPKEKHREE